MRDNREKSELSVHTVQQVNVVDTASKGLQNIVYYPLTQGVYAMGQVVINRAQGVHGLGQVVINRAQGVSAMGQVIFVKNLVGA